MKNSSRPGASGDEYEKRVVLSRFTLSPTWDSPEKGGVMTFLMLREPASALTHGVGLVLAVAAARHLWQSSQSALAVEIRRDRDSARYLKGRSVTLLIFGFTLALCYAASTLFHAAPLSGRPLRSLHRIDHVCIYLLIAGTYTPIAWSLFRGLWRWGTLVTVWSLSVILSIHILDDGTPPIWISTASYMMLGWSALFCYRELARVYSHRILAPLPLGGVLYSVGAVFNALRWPAIYPGVFGPHDLFHLFVIAGSACHVWFMLRVVIPAHEPKFSPPQFSLRQPTLAPIMLEAQAQAHKHGLRLSSPRTGNPGDSASLDG